jgi:hypothetical protein
MKTSTADIFGEFAPPIQKATRLLRFATVQLFLEAHV